MLFLLEMSLHIWAWLPLLSTCYFCKVNFFPLTIDGSVAHSVTSPSIVAPELEKNRIDISNNNY